MHFLILSGANERAIVAACRSLIADGVGFSIIARPLKDPLLRSHLRPHIVATREQDALNVDDLICTLQSVRDQLPDRLLYLPASEALNRLVLSHRARLETECRLEIPLPDLSVYEVLSDKARFNALAQRFGMALPPIVEAPRTAPLPLVAKPHTEFDPKTGLKLYPVLMLEEAQRTKFFQSEDPDAYFYQRYLDGRSHYYLFFFDRNGGCVALFQENIAQQPEGKSILVAQSCPCPSAEFLEQLTRCIRSTGFHGFCMVEAITVSERSYLIELNPRLWGPLSLAIRAGFQISWLGRPERMKTPAQPCQGVRYAWLSGMLRTKLDGGRIRWYRRQGFYSELLAFLRQDIYLSALSTLPMALRELRKR